jgi:hypothetical protein
VRGGRGGGGDEGRSLSEMSMSGRSCNKGIVGELSTLTA